MASLASPQFRSSFLPVTLLVALIYASGSNLIKANPNDLLHVCSYKQYSIYLKNDTFHNCTNCPSCLIGTGLVKECGAAWYEGTLFSCHACVNGSTFNNVEAAVPCNPCDIQPHRTVVEPCNSMTDTRYADSCEEGYYFKETITGACKACSCCAGVVNATCTELVDFQEIICKCPDVRPTSIDNATLPPTRDTLGLSNSSFTTGNFTSPMTADVKFSKPEIVYWKIVMGIVIPIIMVAVGGISIGCIVHHRRQHRSNSQDIPLIQPLKEIPLSKMSLNFREHLRKNLDIEKPRKNWYHVGRTFGVSEKDLELMKLEYKRQAGSPTVALLETLCSKGTCHPYTIGELLNKLERLGRSDIIGAWDWNASCEE